MFWAPISTSRVDVKVSGGCSVLLGVLVTKHPTSRNPTYNPTEVQLSKRPRLGAEMAAPQLTYQELLQVCPLGGTGAVDLTRVERVTDGRVVDLFEPG